MTFIILVGNKKCRMLEVESTNHLLITRANVFRRSMCVINNSSISYVVIFLAVIYKVIHKPTPITLLGRTLDDQVLFISKNEILALEVPGFSFASFLVLASFLAYQYCDHKL